MELQLPFITMAVGPPCRHICPSLISSSRFSLLLERPARPWEDQEDMKVVCAVEKIYIQRVASKYTS